MMDCERILDVEEMVLGRGTTTELRRHVAACDACREAEALLREELGLFVARRAPPKVTRRPVPVKRWAALAVAASLALVGSALRTEEHRAPEALACMMPIEGEALACMLVESAREPVTSSVATP